MRSRCFTITLAATLAAIVLGSFTLAKPRTSAPPEGVIGRRVAAFRLLDPGGSERTLADYRNKRALVLVFVGADCPISNSYAQPLAELAARFGPRGVQFLAVNAQPEETLAQVARHAGEYRFGFPVLKDSSQALADVLDAHVTGEAFALDGDRTVRYRGRIDDQYADRTRRKARVSSHDLEEALEAVLAGKPVARPVTRAYGCQIVRPQATTNSSRVTYYRDVLPVLQERCQDCHRPGQIAPFSLLTYADARRWAQEMKQVTSVRQMPPWQAEPSHAQFQEERRLTEREIAVLAAWADGRQPAGDPKTGPAPRQWADGWRLGTPDLVLSMPEEFELEPTGDDVYRCFVLPTHLAEDREVAGVEIRPGNPRVVHHVITAIDRSGQARKLDEKDPTLGYNSTLGGVGFIPEGTLSGWAPGNLQKLLPPGVGRKLAANADVVMQVHYHKSGKVERDRTQIALYFSREPVKKGVHVWPLTNLSVDIPPGESRHVVKASAVAPYDLHAITVSPHMHLLGREIKVWATFPDGTQRDVIWIRNWDFRWQDTYRFKEPFAIPKGTRLDLVAYYDNTADNPLNPNSPPKRVTFGEQTTDEMCFAFFEYTLDHEADEAKVPLFLGLF